MEELIVYGYRIGSNVQYGIPESELVNASLHKSVRLRKTMSRLLSYLLANSGKGVIRDSEILKHVWEVYGLRASSQRLWQVMNELKKKLLLVGFTDHLFFRVEGNGFLITGEHLIPLYCDYEILKKSGRYKQQELEYLITG